MGPYSNQVHLEPGLSGRSTLEVTEADTAIALRSGEVAVLATPRLVALCEEATCAALAGRLAPGTTSVGTQIQFSHLAPSALGITVTAEAVLDKVEGRRLVFTVSASDPNGLVGAGKVTRVLVEIDRFVKRASC